MLPNLQLNLAEGTSFDVLPPHEDRSFIAPRGGYRAARSFRRR